ncbi:MAG TPA: hypothetical protein VGJ92_06135 [Methanocella sp.]|jgi:hypothetical protein
MHPVRLSEKAWNFVESRRGDLLADDYDCVSKMIENVADLSGEGNLLPEGMHLIEVIEARQSDYCSSDTGDEKKAVEIMGYLREAYHGKVPRAVFLRKCSERGLSDEEIARAELTFGQWLS